MADEGILGLTRASANDRQPSCLLREPNRGEGFCDGKRGSFSIRYAVLKLIAAWAADAGFFSVNLDFMYSLIW